MENPSQSFGASLAIWDHTVLPATRHKWTCLAITPANQAGTRFTYPRGMGGWVDLGSPIVALPGIEHTTSWSQVRCPNHYATESPRVNQLLTATGQPKLVVLLWMLFCSAFLHQTVNQQVTNFISPDIQATKGINHYTTESPRVNPLLHLPAFPSAMQPAGTWLSQSASWYLS